jgi:hypothetical protein
MMDGPMTTIINKPTDRQAAILAICFQLQIAVESVAVAIAWLANDVRTGGLEREMVTVKALADEAKDDLNELQKMVWIEFGVNAEPPATPAND